MIELKWMFELFPCEENLQKIEIIHKIQDEEAGHWIRNILIGRDVMI